ncbi:MAG: protein kinase domain-containing protein [Candidatus Acidiferrales bacterium]
MAETTRPFSAGERVGNYQILGLAGAGGMGVVYKALDLKLERTVALKFLPHDVSAEEEDKKRFLREAKAASALDHPNVGVIHGVEETERGRLFIVMAYYEGETLAQKIRQGPLPFREAVDIAIQMAQGLGEAHAHKIIHRDIKPSNVIITSQNVVKIVDFGLARMAATPSMTQSAGITGTVAYMSPEQTMGKALDQRTDIWALGVVLAEMITGQNPFQRDTAASVMFAIVSQPPAPMEGVPAELQKIIYRALSKEAADRYASCEVMLKDLEAIRGRLPSPMEPVEVDDAAPTKSITSKELRKYIEHASGSAWAAAAPQKRGWQRWVLISAIMLVALAGLSFVPPIHQWIADRFFAGAEKHIAVLPFDNIGNDPANEVLAEGLMDSLTSRLSNLEVGQQALWVVPASVVRSRKVEDPTAALRVLGATLVVKGSIEREGQDIHLTVNLINAKTMRQVGSVALEDRAGDLATLQDETVSRLSNLMGIAVTPEMLKATAGKVNPAAYESYLKALGYIQRYDKPGNLQLAIGELENSTKRDPRFALGFAEMGEAYRLRYQVDANPKWLDEASANCGKAVQLDDGIPAVYVTLGRLHSEVEKYDLALQEFEHAFQLDAHDADAVMGEAGAYEHTGRLSDAEDAYKKAAALRPDYWDGYNSLGLFYDRQNKYAESIAQFLHAAELTPDNAQVYSNLAAVYMDRGEANDNALAEEALKKSIDLGPSYPAYANLGELLIHEHRFAESAAVTEKALAINDKNYIVWSNLGNAYEWQKDTAKADAARERELELLEDFLRLKPRDAPAQAEVAYLYAKKKMRDQAQARIQSAVALAPTDGQVLASVGEAYEKLGKRPEALHYVELALQKGFLLDDLKSIFDLQDLLKDPNFRPPKK